MSNVSVGVSGISSGVQKTSTDLRNGWIAVADLFPPSSLSDGWAENFSLNDSLLISPLGDVYVESFLFNPENDGVCTSIIRSEYSVDISGDNISRLRSDILSLLIEKISHAYNGFGHRVLSALNGCSEVFLVDSSGFVFERYGKSISKYSKTKTTHLRDVLYDVKNLDEVLKGNNNLKTAMRQRSRKGVDMILVDIESFQPWQSSMDIIMVKLRKVCFYKGCKFSLYELIRDNYTSLTDKEADALSLLVSGIPIKSIAHALSKSQVTVGLQIRAAMHKIGSSSLTELQAEVLMKCRL